MFVLSSDGLIASGLKDREIAEGGQLRVRRQGRRPQSLPEAPGEEPAACGGDRREARPGLARLPRRVPELTLRRGAAQDALVADPARDPVGVEALQEELRRLAADAEQVAKAGERDAPRRGALVEEELAGPPVRGARDGDALAQAYEHVAFLERPRQARVRDLHAVEAGLLELERGDLVRARVELPLSAREVEPRALPLEAEKRHDRRGPRLGGRVDPGI